MADSDDELFGAEHVRVYRETNGDRGYHWRGTQILLLTTTGRKSGEQRTTPLIHAVDGDRFVVIASKGGAPEDPAWFRNMQADPTRRSRCGPRQIPVADVDGRRRRARAPVGRDGRGMARIRRLRCRRPIARSRSSC